MLTAATSGGRRLEGQHLRARLRGTGVQRLLRKQGALAVGLLELLQQHVNQLVLVDHGAVLQQLPEARLRDPLRQGPLRACGLGADVLDVVLRQLRCVAGPMRHPVLPVAELASDDLHVVVLVLVRPVQVEVREAATRERGRALQEVVLALPALHAAGRRGAVVVREVRQLAHETAPVDALVLDVRLFLARELRGPEEFNGLVRDVVAGSPQGRGELLLADEVAPLRVQLAEGLAELVAVLQDAVDQRLRSVADVALLGLVHLPADVDARPVDQVAELLKGDCPLAVLVHGPDEQLALLPADHDAHLVEDLLQVVREHEPPLRQRAVPEHVHEPRPAGVALANDLLQPLHPRDGVSVLGGWAGEVGQVHGPHLKVIAGLLADGVYEVAARVVLFVVEVQGMRHPWGV
mmetsp:Transcript_16749/g.46068  ORF Transcript_16749/g.46068 Transcript_16749/m.46068 type:complete len:407 (-) Transcript_16749:663-1883(-)